jgi:thioredoxin reductase/polyferredoxin
MVGDLTGIPLLSHAIESGAQVIRHFVEDVAFQRRRSGRGSDAEGVDVAIVGAGPAGVAAAIECRRSGLSYRLLEASAAPFATIDAFPLGKPIRADGPTPVTATPSLRLEDGTRETLLASLRDQLRSQQIEVVCESKVAAVRAAQDQLIVEHSGGELRASRVVIAVGKSGRPRRLNVPGEDLPMVQHRLHDPQEYRGRRVVVNGGGDTAVEAALALEAAGAHVTHVYRGSELSRTRAVNRAALEVAFDARRIARRHRATVARIADGEVLLNGPGGPESIPCEALFLLIGSDPPTPFLRRCGVELAGDTRPLQKLHLITMLSFFGMLYFGKKGATYDIWDGAEGVGGHIVNYLRAPWVVAQTLGPMDAGSGGPLEHLIAALRAPFLLAPGYGLSGYDLWLAPLAFLIAWVASLFFVVGGGASLLCGLADGKRVFGRPWPALKHAYLALAALLFFAAYLRSTLGTCSGWVSAPTQLYSFLYCTTMLLFGARRVWVRRTRYVLLQTLSLLVIQIFFLYLLPFQRIGGEYLFDRMITGPLSGHPALLAEVFPQGRWTSFWFILFWPLSITSFGATRFWTLFPVLQLGFLFWLLRRYGKGAYCGWICSCGGMAETLGDEYRALAPHGPKAKRWENAAQLVLLFAVVATLLHTLAQHQVWFDTDSILPSVVWGIYLLLVDVVLAGVLGLGLYFLLGGRTWCRFFCPLAAVMHLMTRFSRYRIFSHKEHCISCNACTRTCHMGIDVMGFANRGIPMNDVECVRCSSCVTACPMQVLAFGRLPQPDVTNRGRGTGGSWPALDWRSGLR